MERKGEEKEEKNAATFLEDTARILLLLSPTFACIKPISTSMTPSAMIQCRSACSRIEEEGNSSGPRYREFSRLF